MTKARSNATANAAKGDLTVGNGTNLSGVLGVGSNGDTIVADSSTSTGLRYTAGTVSDNPVLNSAFQVWQRGTSFAISAGVVTYVADRWCCLNGNTGSTVSRQTTSDTTNLPFIQYCARLARNSGTTSTGGIQITQSFETVNSLPFAGKTVTMSFYARAGANFSSASNALTTYLITGTGTDQNHPSGYTGQATPVASSATLTTTWQRFSFTGTIAATATEIAVNTGYTPVGTAGANDYYEITGWQIDVGSVALPFRTYAATIQGELSACQRYYWNWNSGTNGNLGIGRYTTGTEMGVFCQFPVTMRIAPSLVVVSGTNYYSIGADNFNSFTIYQPTTTTTWLYNGTEVSGTSGVTDRVYTNNAAASVSFSAEL